MWTLFIEFDLEFDTRTYYWMTTESLQNDEELFEKMKGYNGLVVHDHHLVGGSSTLIPTNSDFGNEEVSDPYFEFLDTMSKKCTAIEKRFSPKDGDIDMIYHADML